MELLLWIFPALAASLFSASFGFVNHHYKADGRELVLWRGFVPFLLTLPFAFFFAPPQDPLFYLYVIINSVAAFFSDIWLFEATKRFGASIPLRLNPLSVFLTFLVWLAIDHTQIDLMLQKPLTSIGIVIAMGISLASLSFMKKCEVTAAAFRFYAPRLLLSSFVNIMNKTAMSHAEGLSGPIYYAMIMSFVIFLLSLPANARPVLKKGVTNFVSSLWKPGFLVGIACLFLTISKNFAMRETPNPGYVSAIIMMSPLWVTLFSALHGEKETGKMKPWFLLLGSSITMLFLFQNLQETLCCRP